MTRAYYSESIPDFAGREPSYILGVLAQNHQFALEDAQKRAWMAQIGILKIALQAFRSGHIFFEYSIPRMGKRVDNILLLHGTIIVLEFKVGEVQYSSNAIDQVLDYALVRPDSSCLTFFRQVMPYTNRLGTDSSCLTFVAAL